MSELESDNSSTTPARVKAPGSGRSAASASRPAPTDGRTRNTSPPSSPGKLSERESSGATLRIKAARFPGVKTARGLQLRPPALRGRARCSRIWPPAPISRRRRTSCCSARPGPAKRTSRPVSASSGPDRPPGAVRHRERAGSLGCRKPIPGEAGHRAEPAPAAYGCSSSTKSATYRSIRTPRISSSNSSHHATSMRR